MKNILCILPIILFCTSVFGISDNFGGISYLTDAANAWSKSITNGGGYGLSRTIPTEYNTTQSDFLNDIRDIAYNDTAITILTINQHSNHADKIINSPLLTRRNTCIGNITGCPGLRRTLVISGDGFGTFSDYKSNKNSDFKTNGRGLAIHALAFVTNGFAFGVQYTHNENKTHDTPVHSNATSNSVTMFTKYLSPNNIFINFGISGGQTSWDANKIISSVGDKNIYNTDFYSTLFTIGSLFQHNRISITPQIFAKYIYMKTDKHTDSILQSYNKWWFNKLTGGMKLNFGFDFYNYNLVIRPTFHLGADYDAISRGTSHITVKLTNNEQYRIPIDTPQRFATNGGIGISVSGNFWTASINYKIDYRHDYTDNTAYANIKTAF